VSLPLFWPIYGFLSNQYETARLPWGWHALPSDMPQTRIVSNPDYAEASVTAMQLLAQRREDIQAPSLSAAIVIDGDFVWAGAIGWSDIANNVPVDTTTTYRIGSTSKAVGITGLARLTADGIIDLGVPISSYADDLPNAEWNGFTAKQLASHTAGLAAYEENNDWIGFYQSLALTTRYTDPEKALSVFDDADIDAAVAGAMMSKYRNSGQTCVCANRFIVQDGVYDEFCSKLAEAASKLVVGAADSGEVNQGPLINQAAVDKVAEHVEDAVSKGAKILLGGAPHELGGLFYQPTVLADVNTDMNLTREETFGPVAPVFRFKEEAEGVALANATEFGLAAYFYSQDINRVWRVSEALESGIVGVNEGIISTEAAPFGGVKESGIGREGSKYGIEDYLEMKYICMGGVV